MTNLIPSGRYRWITRGRLVVGLPTAIGALLSLFAFLVFVRPIWNEVRELGRRRDFLLEVKRLQPVMEQRLEQESVALREAQRQQALLIRLLAAPDKVDTFLARLNQQAVISGVTIYGYEPLKMSKSPSATKKTEVTKSKLQKTKESVVEEDPLLSRGYQKLSVALAVRGPYSGLLEFLRRMEALDLFVQSSDLKVKAPEKAKQDMESSPAESRTELTLKLSFYDRQLDGSLENDNDDAK